MTAAKEANTKSISGWLFCVFFGGVVLLGSGCGMQRVIWSPDGAQAAVLGNDGLFLCQSNGAAGALMVSNTMMAAWFPDNKRLALLTSARYESIRDLAAKLDKTESERIEHYAIESLESRNAGHDFATAIHYDELDENENAALAVYLKGAGESLKEWVGDWDSFQKSTCEVFQVQIATVSNGRVTLGRTLLRTLAKPTPSLRLSPDGTAVLLTEEYGKRDAIRLLVIPTDGSSSQQVISEDCCRFPDWSSDSRSVVFVEAVGKKDADQLRMGRLTRRHVSDARGIVEVSNSTNEHLCDLLFDSAIGVRCLGDGRILFLAAGLHLPAKESKLPETPEIFVFDSKTRTSGRLSAPRDTVADADFFDISPDGKKLLVAGKKGAVSVMDLDSGGVEVVQGPGPEDAPSSPSWRGDQICLLAPAPSNSNGQKWEVGLWKNGKARSLSTNWPSALRKGFLDSE